MLTALTIAASYSAVASRSFLADRSTTRNTCAPSGSRAARSPSASALAIVEIA